MSILRGAATVGGYTMMSRVLGFVRDLLIAATMGAGPVADAFLVAFRLPNLFRRLFAEGAFNAAFVPLFARALQEAGEAGARAFAGQVLSVMVLILAGLTGLALVAMPALVLVLAPGFAKDPQKLAWAVEMGRLAFPYLFFMGAMAVLAGVLNGIERFAAAAAAPVILNILMIGALLVAAETLETPGHALALAVLLAGAAQLALVWMACRRAGFTPSLPRPRLTPRVRRMLKLMVPGAIGAGVMQINLLVGTIIASLLPTGAIAWLYYADRIYQLPLGVIGIAVGTVLLPQLSRALKAGRPDEGDDAINRAIELALFFTLPATVALAVVAGPIVEGLFQRGEFDGGDTAATAAALRIYALGLPAFVLVKVLAPGFFAREDTRTPVIVAGFAVAANIALGLALYRPMGHVGLALATTLASWLNAGLLWVLLTRDGTFAPDRGLWRRSAGQAAAAAAMGLALAATADAVWGMATWGGDLHFDAIRAMNLLAICGLGLAAYLVLALAFGGVDRRELKRILLRRKTVGSS